MVLLVISALVKTRVAKERSSGLTVYIRMYVCM